MAEDERILIDADADGVVAGRGDEPAIGGARALRAPARPATLFTAVRQELRLRHYSPRTETAYLHWIRRYIRFFDRRHPRELPPESVRQFLAALTIERQVSAATQNQALAALRFLHRDVLGRPHGWLTGVPPAKQSVRLPTVLSRAEVGRVLARLDGRTRLVVLLLYGSGLRLLECFSLRVKDLSFDRRELLVRGGKGARIE
jgi:site-specific recombinase XerD